MKQREFKFRFWDIKKNKMNRCDWMDYVDYLSKFFIEYDEIIPNVHLMQCTGLKDCNGKDIYEGDILDAHQTINGQSRFVITNCIGEFDLRYAHDLNRKYEYSIISFLGIEELEVIGNIYEDEGLLAVAP